MTLINRVVKEKRVPVTVVGISLAAAVGLYALGVYPSTIRVSQAREREVAAAARLAVAQQALETARGTAEGKTQVDADLEQFYGDVLPRDLAGARGITYPSLAALATENNLLLERRSTDAEMDRDSQLARLRTTMLLRGEWPDIRRFIHAMETAAEFIVIEQIELSQGEEVGASPTLTLSASTFYRAEGGT